MFLGSVRGGSVWVRGNWGSCRSPVPLPGPEVAPWLLHPLGLSWLRDITSFQAGGVERLDGLQALCQDGVGRALLAGDPAAWGSSPCAKSSAREFVFFPGISRQAPLPMAVPLPPAAFSQSLPFLTFPPFSALSHCLWSLGAPSLPGAAFL